jgi:hypothetical protein
MTADQSFKEFKACLTRRLRTVGFSARNRLFFRPMNDTLLVLELQRHRSTKEEVRFTVNVGLSIDLLRAATPGGLVWVPAPNQCHWQMRLGKLLQAKRDVWWAIRDEQTALATCDEIAAGLIDTALPKVEAVASSSALAALWQAGEGAGITEFEERANLVKLLYALGRTEAARDAIQALEDASRGKTWEMTATFLAIALRKEVK